MPLQSFKIAHIHLQNTSRLICRDLMDLMLNIGYLLSGGISFLIRFLKRKNSQRYLVICYQGVIYYLPGGKLSKLCQEGFVSEYQTKFEEMCTRVLGLPDSFILEMYISGLKDTIQAKVLRDKPTDIHEAFELSLLVESQQQGNKGGYYKPFVPKQTKLDVPASNTMVTSSIAKTVTNKLLVFKRLSLAERKERASKGLCFNYDDKFSPGHKCKGRIFRPVSNDPLTSGQLKCLIASTKEVYLLYLEEKGEEVTSEIQNVQPELKQIIQKFTDVFAPPIGMPPHRDRDHFIHLESGTKPVNVRPYRYP